LAQQFACKKPQQRAMELDWGHCHPMGDAAGFTIPNPYDDTQDQEADATLVAPLKAFKRRRLSSDTKLQDGDWDTSRTMDDLDSSLLDALSLGSITEVLGPSRSGKTTLLCQLAVLAQQPQQHLQGKTGRALYIDVDGAFRPQRVAQIAAGRGMQPDEVMDRLYCARCGSFAQLLDFLDSLPRLLSEEPQIVLILIDSVIGILCCSFSDEAEVCHEASNLCYRVLSQLRWLAEEFKVAVGVSNGEVMVMDHTGMTTEQSMLWDAPGCDISQFVSSQIRLSTHPSGAQSRMISIQEKTFQVEMRDAGLHRVSRRV